MLPSSHNFSQVDDAASHLIQQLQPLARTIGTWIHIRIEALTYFGYFLLQSGSLIENDEYCPLLVITLYMRKCIIRHV